MIREALAFHIEATVEHGDPSLAMKSTRYPVRCTTVLGKSAPASAVLRLTSRDRL